MSNLIDADTVNVTVNETNNQVSVGILGIQGPAGDGGSSGSTDVFGLISTGNADLRYYSINNPSGYITGFNSGLYYLVSNPEDYIRSNTALFVNTTGSQLITGTKIFVNMMGTDSLTDLYAQDVIIDLLNKVTYDSQPVPSIDWENRELFGEGGAGVTLDWWNRSLYGDWTKNGNYILTNLDSGNLQTQIDIEKNKNSITGISITGSDAITGLVNIVGVYGTNIILSGNTIGISGGDTSSSSSSQNILNAITGSGTVNYIPKFINGSGLNNGPIAVDNNGKVYFTNDVIHNSLGQGSIWYWRGLHLDDGQNLAFGPSVQAGSWDLSIGRYAAGVAQIGTTANNALGSLILNNLTANGTGFFNKVGINTSNPISTLDVSGNITCSGINLRSLPPAASSSPGNVGQITWDTGWLYVCTSGNTWKRVGLSTW